MTMMLPIIRTDMRIAETWHPAVDRQLRCPVTVFSGNDDELAGPNVMTDWSKLTSSGFRQVTLPGGHFFLHDTVEPILTEIAAALSGPA